MKHCPKKPGLLVQLQYIQIDVPEDFALNLDLLFPVKNMLTRIFLDTLFVIASVNRHNQYHAKAVKLATRVNGYPLLTTDIALLELGNALARNYKHEAIEIIEEFLESEDVEIVHLTLSFPEQVFDMYKTYPDKEWGLIDCVSFVVMRERDMTWAVTCN